MTLFVAFLCALADRMRGGFPERKFAGRNVVRMGAWYGSGALVALLLAQDWWALLAGVLYAQGDRQDMSVVGQLLRRDGSLLKGWLGQLRIGAVFAACVAPMLAVDLDYWPMVAASLLSPAAGAVVGRAVYKFRGGTAGWQWCELGRGFFLAVLTGAFDAA